MKPVNKTDVLIIGGGISGMTAAVYAARANRSCVILESNITGGLANSTYTVENFPSYIDVHGMDLMQKCRDQVDHLGVEVEEVCEIVKMDLVSQPKVVETEDAVYEAKAVIIATGRKPITVEVPTECDNIHYCAICDGAPYEGKNVVMLGGGNSAFDEGLYLKQLGINKLAVVEIMDRFFAAQATQDDLLGREGVSAHKECSLKDVKVEDGKLVAAILENKNTKECHEVECDGIFVFLGQVPNSEPFKGLIDMDEKGYIKANESMETNIPGVFSSGDINVKVFRQLTTAAADGTVSALMADRYIRSLG
ncbi:FAD-dependent oxidoreductase [Desulfovibrio sp. OttesenSCG-928-C06]|nr:FAD-dependent oxidoreductase [Desulfovibrio sp. OttesenSCG-928-C06]